MNNLQLDAHGNYHFRGKMLRSYEREQIDQYIETGELWNEFLEACVNNDWKRAFLAADDHNSENMRATFGYLWNHVPAPAWGSPAKVAAHRKKRAEERALADNLKLFEENNGNADKPA